jgi:hypothetical protein
MKNLITAALFLFATNVCAQTNFEKLMQKYETSVQLATLDDLESVTACYSTDFDNQDSMHEVDVGVETIIKNKGPEFPPEIIRELWFDSWYFSKTNIVKTETDLVLIDSYHLAKLRVGSDHKIYFRHVLSMAQLMAGYCEK